MPLLQTYYICLTFVNIDTYGRDKPRGNIPIHATVFCLCDVVDHKYVSINTK